MNAYLLVGFVGDYQGSENTLTHMLPVVERGPSLAVPTKIDWSDADLRDIGESEAQYVHFLPTESARTVQEGTLVWLAGADFFNACYRVPALKMFGVELATKWQLFKGPFNFTTGAISGIQDLSYLIYCNAKRELFNALFDPNFPAGETPSIFLVVDNLNYIPELEQATIRALYFREGRDYDRYASVREFAAISGEVVSVDDFDRRVEDLAVWLREQRLREQLPSRSARSPISSVSSHGDWSEHSLVVVPSSGPARVFSRQPADVLVDSTNSLVRTNANALLLRGRA